MSYASYPSGRILPPTSMLSKLTSSLEDSLQVPIRCVFLGMTTPLTLISSSRMTATLWPLLSFSCLENMHLRGLSSVMSASCSAPSELMPVPHPSSL